MSKKYKLKAIFPRPSLDRIEESQIKTTQLRPAVNWFVVNTDRVDNLLMMPLTIFAETAATIRAYAETEFRFTNSIKEVTHALEEEDTPSEWISYRNARYIEIIDLYAKLSNEENDKLIQMILPSLEWQLGSTHESAIRPWLTSAIIGTWTAVETLTGDLWEAA